EKLGLTRRADAMRRVRDAPWLGLVASGGNGEVDLSDSCRQSALRGIAVRSHVEEGPAASDRRIEAPRECHSPYSASRIASTGDFNPAITWAAAGKNSSNAFRAG